MNITIAIALTSGILSFFSPCVFPLIPAYVANLTGTSAVRDNKIDVSKRLVISRAIFFIMGFSVIFVVMGASASLLGSFFAENRLILQKISGFLIIVFGLQAAGILNLRFLMLEKHWDIKKTGSTTVLNSFVLGMAFATGWTPCIGLSLSSILVLAGATKTLYSGLALLFVYSMGLGIPFLLISVMITYSFDVLNKVNKLLPILSAINGWILILLGLLIYTGQMQKISAWLFSITNYI